MTEPVLTGPEPSRLRELDDRVVPRMQRAARAFAGGVSTPALAAHRVEQRLAGGRPYQFTYRNRGLVRVVAMAIALAGAAVHLQRYEEVVAAPAAAERAAALQQTVTRPELGLQADLPAGAVVHGPVLGTTPESYIDLRTAALADLDAGPAVAMISFASVTSVEDIVAALPEDARILRAQYQMPDARSSPLETEIVGSDLAASIDRIIEDEVGLLASEQQAQQELLDSGTIGSEEFERDARNRVEEIKTVRNLLVADGRIVFAVLVEADAAALRDLARDGVVRLVDPLPPTADPDTSVVFGLHPRDVNEVAYGVPA